eukprot:317178-Chlamydomonas_euryale.AAC.1
MLLHETSICDAAATSVRAAARLVAWAAAAAARAARSHAFKLKICGRADAACGTTVAVPGWRRAASEPIPDCDYPQQPC